MSMKNSKNYNVGNQLNLARAVNVKRYPVIAKVIFSRERPDLVSLLTAVEGNSEGMPKRLKEYLHREGLWDKELNVLTEKGEEVRSSGLYAAVERGLYHIWYTDNDPLLGTRPVLMQRDTAFFEPDTKGWLKGLDAKHSDYKVDNEFKIELVEEKYDGQGNDQTKQTLMLSKIEPEVICAYDKSAVLNLNWSINKTSSVVNLIGEVDTLSFHKQKAISKSEKLELSIEDFSTYFPNIMASIAHEFDATWDGSVNRMAVDLDQIQKYQKAVNSFIIVSLDVSNLKTNYGTFKTVLAKDLAIKPSNQDDAELWQRKWLEDFYEKSYHSSKYARERQVSWLDHSALSGFDLALKDSTALLDELFKEKTPATYWHVAAMADLTPSHSKKLRMPVSLINGDNIDLQLFLSQLAGDETIEKMIYSDRYVHTRRQVRNLELVAEYLSEADGLLMTLEAQNGKQATFPENWKRKVFQKKHDNHGRYWILSGASQVYCWECTIGLDFIRETDAGFVVEGTPGFTPKEVKELPQYLQDEVNEMMTLEVA